MKNDNNNLPQTHAVTTPNFRPPTQLDQFKIELERDYGLQVANYFEGEKAKKLKFMSSVVYSVRTNPKLLECDRASLFHAFVSCAEYQLYPSNISGEAYVIPYKGKAQFQLGYQGIITLLARNGVNVRSQIVRQNDKFEYEEGLNARLVHQPDVFGRDRGEAIGVYAIATLENGQTHHQVMSKDEVMKFREFSQAKGSSFSPWNSSNDPELWMWKKTCIKQLAKTLPKTEQIQKAIAEDNEESTIGKPKLDAGGPAVGAAFHDPKNQINQPIPAEVKLAATEPVEPEPSYNDDISDEDIPR